MDILVDDGSGGDDGCGTDDDTAETGTVEAGTLGTVVATDTLYDTSLSDANGCDPAGCTASLTRVRCRERQVVTRAAAVNYIRILNTYIDYIPRTYMCACRRSPSQEMSTDFS